MAHDKVPKSIFLLAFLITLFLLSTVVLIGILLDNKREGRIDVLSADMIASLSEMQTFELMAETYGDSMACLAYRNKLEHLDKSVWDLGLKIDSYRVASEEFQTDVYYLDQKRSFNENEVTYMMLLRKIQKSCSYNQPVVSFFYSNSEKCGKCDDLSFVLTDIKKAAEKEISIFSFDTDLNITTVDLLTRYYGIDEYPCVIIGDEKFCGMRDKDFFVDKLCEKSNLSICPPKPIDARNSSLEENVTMNQSVSGDVGVHKSNHTANQTINVSKRQSSKNASSTPK